jgi:hypothetical protein
MQSIQKERSMEQFTLEDSEGESHTYQLTLHSPLDGGLKIVNRLVTVLSGPLVKVIRTFVDGNVGLDSEMTEVLSNIELEDEIKSCISEMDEDMIHEIMKKVNRDGEDLDKEHAFNRAYRGNYGELMEAVWEVVRANGFLSSVYMRIAKKMGIDPQEIQLQMQEEGEQSSEEE